MDYFEIRPFSILSTDKTEVKALDTLTLEGSIFTPEAKKSVTFADVNGGDPIAAKITNMAKKR